MERQGRLRRSSVAYARYAPFSSRAFHGKEPSRIPSHFSDGLLAPGYVTFIRHRDR
ncbi:MAG: hypothetical protein KTR25_05075 [Myxococcales bacterium]|nr:hypothetical protein [Myxococcales bacterium]